ncbi:MAG: hypothetical protein AAGC60_28025 [Acidobacteriota bacterium]
MSKPGPQTGDKDHCYIIHADDGHFYHFTHEDLQDHRVDEDAEAGNADWQKIREHLVDRGVTSATLPRTGDNAFIVTCHFFNSQAHVEPEAMDYDGDGNPGGGNGGGYGGGGGNGGGGGDTPDDYDD